MKVSLTSNSAKERCHRFHPTLNQPPQGIGHGAPSGAKVHLLGAAVNGHLFQRPGTPKVEAAEKHAEQTEPQQGRVSFSSGSPETWSSPRLQWPQLAKPGDELLPVHGVHLID